MYSGDASMQRHSLLCAVVLMIFGVSTASAQIAADLRRQVLDFSRAAVINSANAAAQPVEPAPPDAELMQQTTLPNGQRPAPQAEPDTFIGRWQARVTATQNRQPHWVTPLVTVTPRLEQEFRTDFVHYYNNSGHVIWNCDNGKGLELIPEKHTELLFNLPPFFDRSNGEQDGFGRSEEH